MDDVLGWVDYRACKEFETVEEVVIGTCEMAEEGECLYVKWSWKLDEDVRGWGDNGGSWDGDNAGTGQGIRDKKPATNKFIIVVSVQ